jgi:hypothetical protein
MRASLLFASLLALPAWAGGKPVVEVDLVYATRGAAFVDPALADVASDLKGLPYQHFDRVAGASLSLVAGEKASADLGRGVTITVTLASVSDAGAAVHVRVTRDGASVLDTEVERPLDRASVLSVGKADAGVLVIPVLVHR